MVSYEMQVLVDTQWVSVTKTGGEAPYRFPNEKEARNMLGICYPVGVTTRVVRVPHESNISYRSSGWRSHHKNNA